MNAYIDLIFDFFLMFSFFVCGGFLGGFFKIFLCYFFFNWEGGGGDKYRGR